MAVFRRDAPIDPMHERGICLGLAEHHDQRAKETTGWDREDHIKAAKACRERAAEWERKASTPAPPPRHPLQHKPTNSHPKPTAAPINPAGQGDLF